MPFTKKEIKINTLGGLLKQARLSQGLKLEEVSKKIGIEVKYLEFLEADDFYKLPSSTYARGFLKRYSEFLKQDAEEIIKQWNLKYHHREKDFPKERMKKENFLEKINPKIVFIGIIVLSVMFYFGWSAKKVLFAPKIELLFPLQDTVVKERPFIIQGKTDSQADVFVNNQLVEEFEKGIFQQRIDLLPGLNTIEISAKKRYSKKSIIYLQVVFEEGQNLTE